MQGILWKKKDIERPQGESCSTGDQHSQKYLGPEKPAEMDESTKNHAWRGSRPPPQM